MNFYIVPPVLYQEQQKLKKKKQGKRKGKSPLSSLSDQGQTRTLHSTPSNRLNLISEVEQANNTDNESTKNRRGSALGSASSKSTETSSNSSLQNSKLAGKCTTSTPLLQTKIESGVQRKRNSTLSSTNSINSASNLSHSSQRDSVAQNRKMSFSQVPTASATSEPPTISTLPKEYSKLPSKSGRMSFEIPKFELILDLTILNDHATAKLHFYNQLILEKRFKNYLNLLSAYQLSDPINFSVVRAESLTKFIKRQGHDYLERSKKDEVGHMKDFRYYEGVLFYELMQCRSFIRQLLLDESLNNSKKEAVFFNETLIELNFVNYIWYVLCLPNISLNDQTGLDHVVSRHYHFKSIFSEVRNALYDLNKENYSDAVSSADAGTNLFMQSVGKVANEFVTLENYLIHILGKFSGNSPIDSRITKHLFSLYDLSVKLDNPESLKVLHYNILLSDVSSWGIAINVPFVRVFEMSINNEFKASINDLQAYLKRSDTVKDSQTVTFHDKDKTLFDQYFKTLNLKNYEHFRSMTGNDLVNLQKTFSEHVHLASLLKDCRNNHFHKPLNLEYYSDSLFTIASNTFHVINCKDAYFQFTAENYQVVLREFYRLLKSGGILELPLFIPGHSLGRKMRKIISLKGSESPVPKILDNFTYSICEELNLLFGTNNVKFSEVLLSPQNSISGFWVQYILFLTNVACGDDNYKRAESDSADSSENPESEDKHYFCYIRAEKS